MLPIRLDENWILGADINYSSWQNPFRTCASRMCFYALLNPMIDKVDIDIRHRVKQNISESDRVLVWDRKTYGQLA